MRCLGSVLKWTVSSIAQVGKRVVAWNLSKVLCVGLKDCVWDHVLLVNVLPFNGETNCEVTFKKSKSSYLVEENIKFGAKFMGMLGNNFKGTTLSFLGATDRIYSNKRPIWKKKVCKCLP